MYVFSLKPPTRLKLKNFLLKVHKEKRGKCDVLLLVQGVPSVVSLYSKYIPYIHFVVSGSTNLL